MRSYKATKAVEVGARIAAVSDPVASGLKTIPTNALSSSTLLGTPCQFQACDGHSQACACTPGTCTGMGTRGDGDEPDRFGRGGRQRMHHCDFYYRQGMCNVFGSIPATRSCIRKPASDLPVASTRCPPSPFPSGISVQYFFLGGLMRLANMTMPPLSTTITGGLSSAAQ
jgi:hypothetical protein